MFQLLVMLSWLHQTAPATVPVVSVPAPPQRLRLNSVDFVHVLQWDRANDTSPDVPYRVSYHTDSGDNSVVPGCERVLEPLQCDLTSACSSPEETYHLWVTALSLTEPSELYEPPYGSYGSDRSSTLYSSEKDSGFYPVRDTELQPPLLQVALCNSSLCVDLDSSVPHLRHVYEEFWYELKVESGGAQQMKRFRSLQQQVVSLEPVAAQFCVSVRFDDHIVPRQSDFGPAQCIAVPGPTRTVLSSVLPSLLVPALLLLVPVVFYIVYMFMKKPPLPSVLTSVLHSEQKLSVTCHPSVSSQLLIDTAPPEEHTGNCSSETDSDDERETTRTAGTAEYASKGSLCSTRGSTRDSTACRVEQVEEQVEEVDLLTLTFCRDKDADTSATLQPDTELTVCYEEEHEEQAGAEEESSEDGSQSGYMLR